MNKLLSSLVTPLLVLLATSLIGALVKGPIEEIANQNRLQAEIMLAPWVEKVEPDKPSDRLDDQTASIFSHSNLFMSGFGVARVALKNNSSKAVSNISFELPSNDQQEAIFIVDGKRTQKISNPKKINIPNMNPGDEIFVFIWGTFMTYEFKEDFKSYSSEGKFRTNFLWPENQGFESGSTFERIAGTVIWYAGTSSAILLIIIMSVAWSQSGEYIKLLFTYPKAYEIEKARFWENPRTFSPDWVLLAEKHFKPHLLFGEPNDAAIERPAPPTDTANPDDGPTNG